MYLNPDIFVPAVIVNPVVLAAVTLVSTFVVGFTTQTGVESHGLEKFMLHVVAAVKVTVPFLSFPVTANPAQEFAVGD